MKACVVKELSGPSGMVYTDIDEVSGDGGKVVIDVRAAGVCFPDLLLTKGEYQLKLTPRSCPAWKRRVWCVRRRRMRVFMWANVFQHSECSAATPNK
ncbi:quinone oxidoreductase [Mycobacterium tuberculosis]|nr:quinone oxidoreductase [Mycobacterium tuberculosis]CMO14035.1 quinone oxidoreductase [Mycobacterium tuberculosis]